MLTRKIGSLLEEDASLPKKHILLFGKREIWSPSLPLGTFGLCCLLVGSALVFLWFPLLENPLHCMLADCKIKASADWCSLSPDSEEDMDQIQELAKLNKLEVIPLVQTFGHVEVGASHIPSSSSSPPPGRLVPLLLFCCWFKQDRVPVNWIT